MLHKYLSHYVCIDDYILMKPCHFTHFVRNNIKSDIDHCEFSCTTFLYKNQNKVIESIGVINNSAACTGMCINSEAHTGYQAQYLHYTDWMNSRRCRRNILPHICWDHIQSTPVCPRSDPTIDFYTPFLLHIFYLLS